jgi:hypothetical protein
MIQALRNMDRLYFGARVGRGSALSMALALLTGFTPWAFVRRYTDGELDDSMRRIGLTR